MNDQQTSFKRLLDRGERIGLAEFPQPPAPVCAGRTLEDGITIERGVCRQHLPDGSKRTTWCYVYALKDEAAFLAAVNRIMARGRFTPEVN